MKILLPLLALAGCLVGCALTETGNTGAETKQIGAQSGTDAEAEGKNSGSTEEGAKKNEAATADETNAGQKEDAEKADTTEGGTNGTEGGSADADSTEAVTTETEADGNQAATSEKDAADAGSSQATEAPVIKDMATIREEYIANLDLEDNPFWDSLVYTGYNIEKHYADGLMWHYVLAAHKRGMGWLSNITYAGGSLGYETTEEGLPDIQFFEKHGLVCASYVTYVYFNYLPNVAGIDTSVLTKPEKSYSANDWYIAAKDWVEQGYSETIDFEAKLTSAGFIDFETLEEMPVGSIIAFCDARNKSDYCSHVVIYAGYQNDYHWVYHVGNENGPEFCSVQRMHFGPDPQWPIAVITTPDFVMEAITAAEITEE